MKGKNYVNMTSKYSSYHIVNKNYLIESSIIHSTTYTMLVDYSNHFYIPFPKKKNKKRLKDLISFKKSFIHQEFVCSFHLFFSEAVLSM